MAQVVNGRYTARMDEPFVVFIIGMRVNRPLDFRKWVPTALAMGPMLKELYANPQKGFLGAETFVYWPGVALLQYWRSFEDLERFARSPDDPHLPAWQRFNRTIGKDGSVGIFHETYIVERGNYEAVYGNMPVFGLAAASHSIPVRRKAHTAAARIGASPTDDPAVEPY